MLYVLLAFVTAVTSLPTLSTWTPVSPCSVPCGGGVQTFSSRCREGGDVFMSCEESPQFVNVTCNDQPCTNLSDAVNSPSNRNEDRTISAKAGNIPISSENCTCSEWQQNGFILFAAETFVFIIYFIRRWRKSKSGKQKQSVEPRDIIATALDHLQNLSEIDENQNPNKSDQSSQDVDRRNSHASSQAQSSAKSAT